MEADEEDVLLTKFYPDVAFAVHAETKNHSSNVQTLGRGAARTISNMQKLNTKSSTDVKAAAADDSVSLTVSLTSWTRFILIEK